MIDVRLLSNNRDVIISFFLQDPIHLISYSTLMHLMAQMLKILQLKIQEVISCETPIYVTGHLTTKHLMIQALAQILKMKIRKVVNCETPIYVTGHLTTENLMIQVIAQILQLKMQVIRCKAPHLMVQTVAQILQKKIKKLI